MSASTVSTAASPPTAAQAVERCQFIMSHAWMVRTFVKHSPEALDFPELMGIVRSVFDTSRALETRVSDPRGYLQMLRKKLPKLRQAARQFREDAAAASDHTNFKQAVISIETCVADLEQILRQTPLPAAQASTQKAARGAQPSPARGPETAETATAAIDADALLDALEDTVEPPA